MLAFGTYNTLIMKIQETHKHPQATTSHTPSSRPRSCSWASYWQWSFLLRRQLTLKARSNKASRSLFHPAQFIAKGLTNKGQSTNDSVNLGSKYGFGSHAEGPKERKHSSVILDPIDQHPIGVQFVSFKNKSDWKTNFNYKTMFEEGYKNCPKKSKLLDLSEVQAQ